MKPIGCLRFSLIPFSVIALMFFFCDLTQSFAMIITSTSFQEGQPIPDKHAHQKENVSPELRIADVPADAQSLVLIVDDPDAPQKLFNHWLVWSIAPTIDRIGEGQSPPNSVAGKNDFGHARYDGPQPPSGTHRYFFHLYAIDQKLNLPQGSTRADLDEALRKTKTIAMATLMGTYSAK